MGYIFNNMGEIIGTTSGADRTDKSKSALNSKVISNMPSSNPRTSSSNSFFGRSSLTNSTPLKKYSNQNSSRSNSSSYQSTLDWFGSPEAYAKEIRRKEAAGQSFSNRAAADAFKRDYSHLFGGSSNSNYSDPRDYAEPSQLKQRNMGDVTSQLQSTMSQYNFPYEQMLRDLMSQPSAYQTPSESGLSQQAQQYAQLQIDPVLSALQSRLANEQTNYGNAKSEVEAAYAGIPAKTQSLLDEARRSALESSIARGMGRSGVVDWQTEKLSSPIMQQATQAETEKAAKLAALANTLTASQSEVERQRQEALTRQGTLQSNRLADLRQQAVQNTIQEQAAKWGQGFNLAQLAQSANMSQQQLMAQLIPLLLNG